MGFRGRRAADWDVRAVRRQGETPPGLQNSEEPHDIQEFKAKEVVPVYIIVYSQPG